MSVLKQFDHLKIKLEAIESATNNFAGDSCIGKGGFGKVYKGDLLHSNGLTTVAIKRLDRAFGQGDSEFWKEVIMLSVYRHENIISLLGFCDEKNEKTLVYEYASRRSLDLHLDNKDLTWVRRLQICIGAARGLAYLHNPAGTQQRVLHRDIKSSNILLDENWNARIADLGLSKFGPANQNYTFLITNNRVGTIGYCDPQYLECGILTKESDVYSFGVVLFKVLCGRLCFGRNDKPQPFTQLVRKHYKHHNLYEVIWDNIKDEIHPSSLEVFSAVAYQCLKNDSEKRPLMEDVVTKLETALEYQEIKTKMSLILNPRAAGPEGSLIGIPGSNQGGNNLTLKGWPLEGVNQLRPRSYMRGSQPIHQLQMLTPQHQQQLLLAQQTMTSQSANDESRRLRMLLNNRSMNMGSKDGLSNSVGDVVPNLGSPMPVLPRGDQDMLLKLKMAQLQQQQQQQNGNPQQQQQQQQHLQHSDTAQAARPQTTAQREEVSGNHKAQTKRQKGWPLERLNQLRVKSYMQGSQPIHQWDDKDIVQADMDRFVEDGSLDDNVESFLSHDDTDPRDPGGRCMDVSKEFTFTEVNSVRASASKVVCCHFSSDGKLLASGGFDKKVVLWYTDSLKPKTSLEEHSSLITDIRFSPSMPRVLATSSFDKTVRVWDADNPGFSLRTFIGHSVAVMSLDFHPNKDDLICSCDGDGEIRYWSINNGSCVRVFKDGTAQVRFQPRHGRYLAAAAETSYQF